MCHGVVSGPASHRAHAHLWHRAKTVTCHAVHHGGTIYYGRKHEKLKHGCRMSSGTYVALNLARNYIPSIPIYN